MKILTTGSYTLYRRGDSSRAGTKPRLDGIEGGVGGSLASPRTKNQYVGEAWPPLRLLDSLFLSLFQRHWESFKRLGVEGMPSSDCIGHK